MLNEAKRLIRRRVAVLLAVLMALSCLPAPALADEQSAEELPVQTAAVSESAEQVEPEHLTEPDAEADEEGIPVDEEHFPDAIFRDYVSTHCDADGNGYLSDEEIAAVETIDCSSSWNAEDKIASLRGVEYFTALTSLYCYNNQLTTLDVSRNTALTLLVCAWNKLTALDMSANTALIYLNCGGNQLTTLDVSSNTALTSLYCYGNQLTSLDVSANTALTGLYCGGNQMTALDVGNNTALTSLECYSNQLTSLDVSKNTALTRLSCYNNQLSTLDVSANTALTYLNCGYNQLTALDVSANTALTELSCGGNQLTTLDVSNNTALTGLYCGGNQLMALNVSANTALYALSCENNQLTALDISQCPKLLDALENGESGQNGHILWYSRYDQELWDNHYLSFDDSVSLITGSEPIELWVVDDLVTAVITPVCDAVDRPTVWCAGYNSAGRMLWVKQKSLTANQMNKLTFDLVDGTASVKVMVLTGDFVPLCKSAVWGQR